MIAATPTRAAVTALTALLAVAAFALPASASTPGTTTPAVHALLSSRELWATIDVCSPPDQMNTVGVRGSMPGDRKTSDKLYMSFRLQYLSSATNGWVDLGNGATPAYVSVGAGTTARQGGRSFQLMPASGASKVTLRGVVDFQWRRGAKVLLTASRPTTTGHVSLAGADPAGTSDATCVIG